MAMALIAFSLKRAAAVVASPATLSNFGDLGPPASETASPFEVMSNSTEEALRKPTQVLKCHRRPADHDCQNEKTASHQRQKNKSLRSDSAKISAATVVVAAEQSDWQVSDAAE